MSRNIFCRLSAKIIKQLLLICLLSNSTIKYQRLNRGLPVRAVKLGPALLKREEIVIP